MPRNLAERAQDPRWWGEQIVHTGLGAVIAYPFILVGVPVSVAVAVSCFAGGLREITQNHGDVGGSMGDSIVDLGAWCLGAMLAGLYQ
jgi:hypothetical protein